MTALILAAALCCTTPQGHRVTLKAPVHDVPSNACEAYAHTMMGAGFCRVSQRPGSWYKLAWECSAPTLWPRGQRVVAVLADSSRVPCDELIAMSPPYEQRVTELGNDAVMLTPASLWTLPYGKGEAVMLFVRFPSLKSDPVAVEVTREGR